MPFLILPETSININETESFNSNEIPITQSDLEKKQIQVGDLVKVHVGEQVQNAIITDIQENIMRLDTQVQIQGDQQAYFITPSGLRLDSEVQIESRQKAYFTSLARDPIFDQDVAYYVFKNAIGTIRHRHTFWYLFLSYDFCNHHLLFPRFDYW